MNHDEPAASGAGESPTPAIESLEAVCDSFEQAWANGRKPRIEDYVARVTRDDRSGVLPDLLQIDLWWRQERGETLAISEYLRRFPNDSTLVEQAFADYHAASTGGVTTDPHAPTHVPRRSDAEARATRGRRAHRPNSPAPASDRNLLFGVLALQMDFISREALIAAMHVWVLAKSRSLGEILLEQKALAPDLDALLGQLVERH